MSALVAVALAQPLEVNEEALNQWELFKVTHYKDFLNSLLLKQLMMLVMCSVRNRRKYDLFKFESYYDC